MLNQTAELGIQVMLYLVLDAPRGPVAPREIATRLDTSPTYTSKVTGMLVKSGLLRAVRGARGGVLLERDPAAITLLEVVEACQGRVLPDYCQPHDDLSVVCSFHEAMHELHMAITGVLERWTLAELAARPCPHESIRDSVECKLGWCSQPEPPPGN
jgi:Rrf2 family protein